MGGNCPVANVCYRYTAPTSRVRQSFFCTMPYDGTHCEYFVPSDAWRSGKDYNPFGVLNHNKEEGKNVKE